MDLLIEREIQKLIEAEHGDVLRTKIILELLQSDNKLYSSDQKYIYLLLIEHSDLDEITERVQFLNPVKLTVKKTELTTSSTPKLHFQERWCTHCEKGVFPERKFSVGALLILLLIGILPGLIYYALVSKKCPICSKADWGAHPK